MKDDKKNQYWTDLLSRTSRDLRIPGTENPKVNHETLIHEINKAKIEVLKIAKIETKREINKQVQADKASLITVFGIFASIISFLTIEFQFLKTVCSFEKVLGFTLILFSLLISFNISLDYLIKGRLDKRSPKPNLFFIGLIIILLIAGVLFSLKGNESKCSDNKIYQKYSENFEEELRIRNKEIEEKLNKQDEKIKNLGQLINKKH
jgi:hypothetical protein